MLGFINKLFDNTARDIALINKNVVQKVNALEPEMEKLETSVLAEEYAKLRARVAEGESLESVMPEAFALIREASKRTLGMRHFDVQLVGGAALFGGRIAEQKTGEGKTLTATLALGLSALDGKGAHLVTANDYLVKVGAEQMGLIFKTLGLSVGLIQQQMDPAARKAAYGCDITYVTNSELGFDYLRDNMAIQPEQLVLRADTPLNFCIIDEVDSILIDEARTPLIISGPSEKPTSNYYLLAKIAGMLEKGEAVVPGDKSRTTPTGDYTIDEKQRGVHLTENGITKAEKLLSIDGLFSTEHMELGHMLIQAIRANELYTKDKDYIVSEQGEVVIVDEFTGRLMPGRRYGEGLHQAIEAKENVKIAGENQTLATITYQNFFKLYKKIGGMTGTAKTEEKEFVELYGADVLVIPTNLPMIRKDAQDLVYRSELGKFKAVVEEIVEKYQTGQPVLVGTISIEKSEFLSKLLSEPNRYVQFIEASSGKLLAQLAKADAGLIADMQKLFSNPGALTPEKLEGVREKLPKNAVQYFEQVQKEVAVLALLRKGVKHNVLNAKYHEREADIVAQAGRSGSITISTNMAGRGTDIKLGGNPEFAAYAHLEKKGLNRYDDSVELFVAACIRGDLKVARSFLENLPQVTEDDIELIIKIRDDFKADFEKVKGLGGLHIMGTERHESRRIDNQLRGRAGRQGDPGSSKFYLSFEDDLMRLFANETVVRMLDRLGMDDTQPIEAGMVTRSIETAQKRVEDRNFAIRKQLLAFDDVMSKQREVVYAQRREVLLGNDEGVNELVEGMISDFVNGQVGLHLSGDTDQWNLESLKASLVDACPTFNEFNFEALRELKRDEVTEKLLDVAADAYEAREQQLSAPLMRNLERFVVLQIVDQFWKDHLHSMDLLRSGIFLRGYGQKDPFVEFKFEGTNLFNEMTETIKAEVTKFIFRMQVNFEAPPQQQQPETQPFESGNADSAEQPSGNNPFQRSANPFIRSGADSRIPKLSRQERRKLERDEKKKK
jgi:preprotein translocase subunit SecA